MFINSNREQDNSDRPCGGGYAAYKKSARLEGNGDSVLIIQCIKLLCTRRIIRRYRLVSVL